MKKANGILLTLVFLFGLLLVGCREEPAPLPQGDTRPTKPLPTGTPTPTPDPYRGVENSWIERKQIGSYLWTGGYERDEVWTSEFADTPATGEREALNDIEKRILSGECVLLGNGAELDLDGNGTREKISFENKQKIQIGARGGWTGNFAWYTGNVYGVCLDAENPLQIHLFIEMVEDQTLGDASPEPFYELLTYRQEEGYCWADILSYPSGFPGMPYVGVPFSPQEWSGLSENGTYSVNGEEFLYRCWETEWGRYSAVFPVPEGTTAIGQYAVTTVDIFAYNNKKRLVGYIPVESCLLLLAGNEEWLYVTDCHFSVYAYVQLLQEEQGATVDAPDKKLKEEVFSILESAPH
ncbi:MAG: hypothetical protein Q4C48_09230 [Lachnospiraceae bacterium]|nr:hypothetical protein [Lachnospiraceae bacterium]